MPLHPFIPLLAHGGKPHNLHDLARTWGLEPFVLIGLALSAWLYIQGLVRLWSRTHTGAGIRKWEAWCYAGGWFSLFIALVSPLHPWGRVLFSAHMTQHEVLMLVAAPLLILGRPLIVYLYALPVSWARPIGRATHARPWIATWHVISLPFVAWLIHAIALWIWHLPALFQATIDNDWIHTLQHASFLGSALLFWWAVIHGRHKLTGYGMAVLYMFTTALHSGLLGALITFARHVWYPEYAHTTASWGLTPLEDQQLGGLIMWIPAGFVYIFAGLAFMVGWMRESERRVKAWENARRAARLPQPALADGGLS
jgi:cytochrome c oxidase assembly factor CtaG